MHLQLYELDKYLQDCMYHQNIFMFDYVLGQNVWLANALLGAEENPSGVFCIILLHKATTSNCIFL